MRNDSISCELTQATVTPTLKQGPFKGCNYRGRRYRYVCHYNLRPPETCGILRPNPVYIVGIRSIARIIRAVSESMHTWPACSICDSKACTQTPYNTAIVRQFI
jgi:hypothetical protein